MRDLAARIPLRRRTDPVLGHSGEIAVDHRAAVEDALNADGPTHIPDA